MVVLIEGTPIELKRKVNSLIKRYGCKMKNTKLYDSLQTESNPARTIYLLPDIEDINCKGIMIFVIAINTEARRYKFPNVNLKKEKIVAITHEIRHVVDRIIEPRHIDDLETPAYLTGYLSGELLID